MLNWLGNIAATRDKLRAQVARYDNADFMEATMAGCALVAAADGMVTADEKHRMADFIQRSEELNVFDMSTLIARFNSVMDALAFDPTLGRTEALKKIAQLRGNDEAAGAVVRLCCVIGATDGALSAAERKAATDICNALGLAPSDFDL